jgi:hypothetical protein
MSNSILLSETRAAIKNWRDNKETINEKIPVNIKEKLGILTSQYPIGFLCKELNLSRSLIPIPSKLSQKKFFKKPKFISIASEDVLKQRPLSSDLALSLEFSEGLILKVYRK